MVGVVDTPETRLGNRLDSDVCAIDKQGCLLHAFLYFGQGRLMLSLG